MKDVNAFVSPLSFAQAVAYDVYGSWSSIADPNAPSSANKGTGWQRNWDASTKTPWFCNDKTKIFIGYDDPQGLAGKVNYVRKNNYGGVMIWALNQDNGELLSTVAAG
jgi:chitinase